MSGVQVLPNIALITHSDTSVNMGLSRMLGQLNLPTAKYEILTWTLERLALPELRGDISGFDSKPDAERRTALANWVKIRCANHSLILVLLEANFGFKGETQPTFDIQFFTASPGRNFILYSATSACVDAVNALQGGSGNFKAFEKNKYADMRNQAVLFLNTQSGNVPAPSSPSGVLTSPGAILTSQSATPGLQPSAWEVTPPVNNSG